MTKLLNLYKKMEAAQAKFAEAHEYSDWSQSIRGYKSAETKASNQLYKAMRDYLGNDCTTQDLINLMTKLQLKAAA